MRPRCPHLPRRDWKQPDCELWSAAREGSKTTPGKRPKYRDWSGRHWNNVEEAYAGFLGWLDATGRLDWSVPPVQRCTADRLREYIVFLEKRVRARTALNRIVHLQRALFVFDPTTATHEFRNAARRLRRQARRQPRYRNLPTQCQLVALGFELMAKADARSDPRARVNAVLFRDGLAIAMLAYRPLRRTLFANLRIGKDLVQRGDHWSITVPSRAVRKNHRHIVQPLPDELLLGLTRYIEVYRPVLMCDSVQPTDNLWVTYRYRTAERCQGDEGRWASASRTFYLAVARRTKAAFGLVVSPHDFRRAAAKAAASLDDAATVLVNSKPIAERHYRVAHRDAHVRQHLDVLARYRE